MSGISSVLLLVIVIFAAVFFLFGILHLLTRHFMATSSSYQQSNNRSREYEASSSSSSSSSPASQLQHLFRLHDSGLDQSIIDALPVFRYSDVMNGGSVEPPFDCSVCLSEFSGRDSLRLLPLCSHAFHTHCIDTWLLSNSTCPLCRSHIGASTAVAVAESPLREEGGGVGEGLHGSFKTGISKRVFSVRLGKLRSFVGGNNGGGGGAAGSGGGGGLDGRRCYSMGSCQYIVDDRELKVVKVHHGGDDDINTNNNNNNVGSKRISARAKGESFSVSKIWLWSKNNKGKNSSLDENGNGSSQV